MAGRSHYDVLGVSQDATPATIRDAYRRLARQHHPDRSDHGSAVGGDRMHDVNEAYRVLGDPGRRALYDAELRRAASAPPTVGPAAPMSSRPTAEADESRFDLRRSQPNVEPARVPWRMLVTAAAIGVVGVLVLAQLTDPGEEPPPDGILRVGDCVLIEPDNDAREVRCAGDGDLVVRAFVTFDGTCPGLTERHRDQLGMGVACVEAAP